MTSRKCQFGGAKVRLGDICRKGKSSLRLKDLEHDGQYAVYGASGIVGMMDSFQNDEPYVSVIKDGAGVGRAFACEARTSVLGTMQALLPKEGVERDYLLHLVGSLKLGDGFTGSTIPHIYFKDYCKCQVFLPSLDVQRRIVRTLSLIEGQILKIDDELSKLDILIKSRFVEMFGDPESNENGLRKTVLGEVLSVQPSNGLYKPQKDYISDGSGNPIVRIDSFQPEGPDYNRLKRLTCTEVELKRYGLNEGDIVINRVNSVGCMGKTMLISNIPEPTVFESNMMRLHSDEAVIAPAFLCAQMVSGYSKNYFEANAKRAIGQASINQTDVKNLPILVPSLDLQHEYLLFVQQVDKLRVLIQQQKEKLQMLYDSLAQEYFAV